MVDVPALIDLEDWNSPQIRLRRWAGEHGEKHGFTEYLKDDDQGRPEYKNTPEQDAFRHAFVAAAKYLAAYKAIMADPFGGSDELADRISASDTLALGYLNEWWAEHDLGGHLKDYWNNYEGIKLGRDAVNMLSIDASNEALAAFIADKIKNKPERFIFDGVNDPRVRDLTTYETDRLPRGAFGGFVPDPVKQAFPELYGGN